MTTRRKLEALSGHDPDESDPAVVGQMVADAAELGQQAIQELAADLTGDRKPLDAIQIADVATSYGTAANPTDAARLSSITQFSPSGEAPPWRRGYEAAHALREQEGLGGAPVTDERLADLAGVLPQILESEHERFRCRFFVRSGREPDVRSSGAAPQMEDRPASFDSPELLGDRIAFATGERLLPATGAYTYRQKSQRAFAAELLCPFEALEIRTLGAIILQKRSTIRQDTLRCRRSRFARFSLTTADFPVKTSMAIS